MDKKVMFDLLDKGHNGNTILQILDALTEGMNETVEEEELVETPKATKKRSKKEDLVEV
jgi:hypothetical protein